MFSNNIVDPNTVSDWSISNLFHLFINHFGIYIPILLIFIYLHYRILRNQNRPIEKWIFPVMGLIVILVPLYTFALEFSKILFILQNNQALVSALVPKYLTLDLIYFLPHTLFIIIPLGMNLMTKRNE